jgi:hypothetical protein
MGLREIRVILVPLAHKDHLVHLDHREEMDRKGIQVKKVMVDLLECLGDQE